MQSAPSFSAINSCKSAKYTVADLHARCPCSASNKEKVYHLKRGFISLLVPSILKMNLLSKIAEHFFKFSFKKNLTQKGYL